MYTSASTAGAARSATNATAAATVPALRAEIRGLEWPIAGLLAKTILIGAKTNVRTARSRRTAMANDTCGGSPGQPRANVTKTVGSVPTQGRTLLYKQKITTHARYHARKIPLSATAAAFVRRARTPATSAFGVAETDGRKVNLVHSADGHRWRRTPASVSWSRVLTGLNCDWFGCGCTFLCTCRQTRAGVDAARSRRCNSGLSCASLQPISRLSSRF